ncbi:MAG: hypothetical protein FWD63_00635 [Propionibacteriaceae bacterium]|nr:hypothetical protein [Propionibacteriaceae bacterium]
MTLLQVRDFPQDLYEDIGRIAEFERRSIAQQTVVLLRDAVKPPLSDKERRKRIMAEARKRAASLPPVSIPPEVLIREDRDR